MDLTRLIAVARGDAVADLLFVNAKIVNTFTGEIEEGAVAVAEGRVAGVGSYAEAERVVDLKGQYLCPGLIDGHVHIESSMFHVGQYARAVVPHGTVAVVTDLHEIANVAGIAGVRSVLDAARRLPLDLFLMAPSCVPSTALETSGAELGPAEIRQILRWKGARGLGEMMNFQGVIDADRSVLETITAADGRVLDGHAPRVRVKRLNAYLCPLVSCDHECVGYEEGLEKLRRGAHLMIREGSTEKNLEALLPLVNDGNTTVACWWWTTATPRTSIVMATWTPWCVKRSAWAWSRCGRCRWRRSTLRGTSASTATGASVPDITPTCWC
ncbi:MAG: amidohydrolase family protein [SAR202 cluster bacterium]|nr:amidohydrolase family protein [SAR202 cluster bacterium]